MPSDMTGDEARAYFAGRKAARRLMAEPLGRLTIGELLREMTADYESFGSVKRFWCDGYKQEEQAIFSERVRQRRGSGQSEGGRRVVCDRKTKFHLICSCTTPGRDG